MQDGCWERCAESRALWIAFVRLCSVGRGYAKEHPVHMEEGTTSRAPKSVSAAYCEKYVGPARAVSVVLVGTMRGLESW